MLGIHKVILSYGGGEVYIESSQKIQGLEIYYECNDKIAFNLPEGWLYNRNESKIICVSLDKSGIESDKPFIKYSGTMKINVAIIVFDDLTSTRITSNVTKSSSSTNYNKNSVTATSSKAVENERGKIITIKDTLDSNFGKVKIANVGSTKVSDYTISNKADYKNIRKLNTNKDNIEIIKEKFATDFEREQVYKGELEREIEKAKIIVRQRIGGGY